MKTDNNIDKLFREGLKRYRKEPPKHLWGSISSNLIKNFHNKKRRYLISGLIPAVIVFLIIVTGIAIAIILKFNIYTTSSTDEVTGSVLSEKSEAQETVSNDIRLSNQKSERKGERSIKHNRRTSLIISKSKISQADKGSTKKIIETVIDITSLENDNIELTTEINIKESEVLFKDLLPELTHNYFDVKEGFNLTGQNDSEKKSHNSIKKPFITNIIKGFHLDIGQQIIFNNYYSEETINAGFENTIYSKIKFKRLNLSIGKGLTLFTDKNIRSMTVERIDTVGKYSEITYIDFLPLYNPGDSSITGYMPSNIETTEKHLTDTINENRDTQIKRKYTHINFPLILGYDIIQSGRIALSINAGVIFSIRVNEITKVPLVEAGSHIITYTDSGVLRREFYQMGLLGLSLKYHINNKWYISGSTSIYLPILDTKTSYKPLTISAGLGLWL